MSKERPDVSSDPRHDDTVGQDWSDEGGALPEGPAEDPPAASEEPEEISLAEARDPEDR